MAQTVITTPLTADVGTHTDPVVTKVRIPPTVKTILYTRIRPKNTVSVVRSRSVNLVSRPFASPKTAPRGSRRSHRGPVSRLPTAP
jgi:hypothetical protein